MADCRLTNQEINLRADRIFGLSYLDKYREYSFLEAMLNEGVRSIPIAGSSARCAQVKVKWNDICTPTLSDCDTACTFTGEDTSNCVEEIYNLDNCLKEVKYSFRDDEFECITDPNSGALLSHSLEEFIAKKELEGENALIQDALIPYLIGVIEGQVAAPVDVPNNVTVNGTDVEIKPSQVGEALYPILKYIIRKNQISRPLIIVGHQALESAALVHSIKRESALLDRLFGEFPIYFDYDNIFSALGGEAIYVINLDAFALFSYPEAKANVTETTDLFDARYGYEDILRWNRSSRFASNIYLAKYQTKNCVDLNNDEYVRKMSINATLIPAPDGVCNGYPKVIKLVCA